MYIPRHSLPGDSTLQCSHFTGQMLTQQPGPGYRALHSSSWSRAPSGGMAVFMAWNGHTHESMSCCKWHSTVQSQVHAGWPLWWRQSTGSRLVAVRRTLERSCDGSARSVCPKSAVALSWWQSYWWLPSLAPQVFGTGTSGRRHQLVAVVKKSRNYVNILNSKLGM